jgi:hypothetical protein
VFKQHENCGTQGRQRQRAGPIRNPEDVAQHELARAAG